MGRYVIRRLLQFIPTVLGTMFLLHYMTSLAVQFSGNPVRALFGDRTPDPALLAAITERLGYADPCLDKRGDPCLWREAESGSGWLGTATSRDCSSTGWATFSSTSTSASTCASGRSPTWSPMPFRSP